LFFDGKLKNGNYTHYQNFIVLSELSVPDFIKYQTYPIYKSSTNGLDKNLNPSFSILEVLYKTIRAKVLVK
jgi:hypothetical protein